MVRLGNYFLLKNYRRKSCIQEMSLSSSFIKSHKLSFSGINWQHPPLHTTVTQKFRTVTGILQKGGRLILVSTTPYKKRTVRISGISDWNTRCMESWEVASRIDTPMHGIRRSGILDWNTNAWNEQWKWKMSLGKSKHQCMESTVKMENVTSKKSKAWTRVHGFYVGQHFSCGARASHWQSLLQ